MFAEVACVCQNAPIIEYVRFDKLSGTKRLDSSLKKYFSTNLAHLSRMDSVARVYLYHKDLVAEVVLIRADYCHFHMIGLHFPWCIEFAAYCAQCCLNQFVHSLSIAYCYSILFFI